jgi:hypothetical protein
MWNLYTVEQEEAVVHSVIAELGTDVSDVDVLEWLMGFHVSDLDTKGCWAIRLPINDELSHNDSVGCCSA